ncbi:cupin domain-containing protein [Nocardia takedensis]
MSVRARMLVACAVVALSCAAWPAQATPGTDITAVTLGQVSVPDRLVPFLRGTDFVAREITVAPGGSTGWHYHDGPVIGFVRSGVLTHPGPDCAAEVYQAGEFLYEPAGAWNVHIGRNLGTEPLVLDVIYAPPLGDPLFRDAPAPACDSAG